MIVERAKYEKPGVTQLMYVGDDGVTVWKRGWVLLAGGVILLYLIQKR